MTTIKIRRAACAALLLSLPFAVAAAPDPVELLQAYVRIDTINPPGNEARATEFLGSLLDEAGIDYETAESAPGRVNLWARLEGGDQPGLLLLHHSDVVAADPDAWIAPPLSGDIRDGHLYGRGALDMKSHGIMHLIAFLELNASDRPLSRDVVFMATADEEAGSEFGMGWMMDNRAEAFDGIGYTLTEGGGGVAVNGQIGFGIEVAQKFPVWLRVEAMGTPGHGSVPRTDSAVDRLLSALDAIRNNAYETRIVPEVDAYFRQLSARFPGRIGAGLRDIRTAMQDPEFRRALKTGIPQLYALTGNTCAVTRLGGSPKVNVLPAKAWSEVDCRLLPDADADVFLADLARAVGDPNVRIEPVLILTPATSSLDTPLFESIRAVLQRRFPGADIGPSVSTGFTDSHHLRKRGIVSYGLMPAPIPLEDFAGIHGNNERISIDNLRLGSEMLLEIVEDFVYAQTGDKPE